jgi:dTDP-4-dehydrorhamnose reductase
MIKSTPQRIFIVGKNGQVGRELVEQAEQKGVDAISFGSAELDITDRVAVLSAVKDSQPTVVVNAAAYTAVDKAEAEIDLAYAVNRDGVENLALACKAQNIPLIHLSTDYVFDGTKDSPYLESDMPNPIGVYGASKYAGEQVLQAVWSKHIILRVSWVFGIYGNNFVNTMLRLAKQRDALSVVDDQFGAPTSANAIAREILKYVSNEDSFYGLFHLESSPGVTWYEFSQCIFARAVHFNLVDYSPALSPISSSEFPTPVKRPQNSKLSARVESKFPVQYWRADLDDLLLRVSDQK